MCAFVGVSQQYRNMQCTTYKKITNVNSLWKPLLLSTIIWLYSFQINLTITYWLDMFYQQQHHPRILLWISSILSWQDDLRSMLPSLFDWNPTVYMVLRQIGRVVEMCLFACPYVLYPSTSCRLLNEILALTWTQETGLP